MKVLKGIALISSLSLPLIATPSLAQNGRGGEAESSEAHAIGWLAQAAPEASRVDINIPALSLADALAEWSRQTGLQVLRRDTEGVAELTTRGVTGKLSAVEALEKMLAGTGLTYEFVNHRTVRIAPPRTDAQTTSYTKEIGGVKFAQNSGNTVEGHSANTETPNVDQRTATVNDSDRHTDQYSRLEEVVVTAQKQNRAQSVLEVPFSIQAVTEKTLRDANMRSLSDIVNLVPGASETNSNSIGRSKFQIRGVDSVGGDPTVSYYMDDSAYPGAFFAPVARAFDMQRVEVLRGPQPTLYGNSSMGGTIRFITNPPNLSQWEAHLNAGSTATKGGESGYYVDGAVSLPLVEDKLALRLVGSYEDVGGWMADTLGNRDVNDGEIADFRASLLWQATEKLKLKLNFDHADASQNYGQLLSSVEPPISNGLPGNVQSNRSDMFSATLEYAFGFATLSSTTTFVDSSSPTVIHLSEGGLLQQETPVESFNNETRLVSSGDGPLGWLIGTFYTDSKSSGTVDFNVGPIALNGVVDSRGHSKSVFGEVSYEFFDGKLKPALGVRYFAENDQTINTLATSLFGEPAGIETTVLGGPSSAWNPRLNVSYFASDTSLLYLNIAKGFRGGTNNSVLSCALIEAPPPDGAGLTCPLAIDPDALWSYEIGIKQAALERQLQLEVAGYYMDWKNYRTSLQQQGISAVLELGDAELYGIEVSALYAPAAAPGLTLSLAANIADGEIIKADTGLAAQIGLGDGDKLSAQPDYTLTLSGNYVWPMGGKWEGLTNVTFSQIGSQFDAETRIPSKTRNLLRARVGLRNGRMGVYLYGNNLLDESNKIMEFGATPDTSTSFRDVPRQIGVNVTYDLN
jgi:outer membrane receptor protein involved in Fe transport